MQITVASIQHKPKRSIVVTTDGRKLGCWSDKIAQFGLADGGTYEVETTVSEVNGATLTNIAKVTPVNFAPGHVVSPPQINQERAPSFDDKSEQIFVVALLKSLIEAGEVKADKQQLWDTTQMLRGLWRHTFGFSAFTPSEAGSRRVA